MDFIKQLPLSNGYSSILVVMDRLTKYSLFIPTHDTVTSAELAGLFLTHVFSKHGAPSHLTSDRGPEFISHFFQSLGKLLQMKLHFTSGYHPEGDGQTERVNQIVEQYLRAYTNYQQDNWATLLPLTEFAYNNAPSETTGLSPFFANKGYHPTLATAPDAPALSADAQQFVAELNELHAELKTNIAEAQQHYQVYADQRRAPAPNLKLSD